MLPSIYAQTGDCGLLIRDDGASDMTKQILEEEGKGVHWCNGENEEPAWNFWDLLMDAPQADWYAFASQDDVWAKDKLSAAVKKLRITMFRLCI